MKIDITKHNVFMVDLETVGIDLNSPIFQIGMAYSPTGNDETFQASTFIKPDMDRADKSTLKWGASQPMWLAALDEAKKVGVEDLDIGFLTTLKRIQKQLEGEDLKAFNNALSNRGSAKSLWVSNAPTFDLAMLRTQMKNVPWQYWQEFCYRTAKTIYGEPINFGKVAHDAGVDAERQLKNLIQMFYLAQII